MRVKLCVKTLRTVILTIYGSKETYNTLVGFFHFLFHHLLYLVKWSLIVHTMPKRDLVVRTTKTELKLCKGAINTPIGVREIWRNSHQDPFSCFSLVLFIRPLQWQHDVVTTFSISSMQLIIRKEEAFLSFNLNLSGHWQWLWQLQLETIFENNI